MRLSSIVIVCLAMTSTRGSLSEQEKVNLFSRVQDDLSYLQHLKDAISRSPRASGTEILSQFSPEWIARVRQIYSEGPAAIEAMMQRLGHGLGRFGKDPSFLHTAFGALQFVLFQYQHNLSKSISHESGILDPYQLFLMENFMNNDPYIAKPESIIASIDMRYKHMSRFPTEVIKDVCKWFKLGYGEFARRVREVGEDVDRFALGDFYGEPYFRATALACRAFELSKRREVEYSQSGNESKISHK